VSAAPSLMGIALAVAVLSSAARAQSGFGSCERLASLSSGEKAHLFVACISNRPRHDANLLGVDGTKPDCVVEEARLTIGKCSVSLPRIAVGNLSNVSACTVRRTPSGILKIDINGGDAASSYRATYSFLTKAKLLREIHTNDENGDVKVWKRNFAMSGKHCVL
jgi:hypothetical protein